MGEISNIQWTHATFSPWEGCAKVSDGCKNCYAETRNTRFHGGQHWGVNAPRLMRSESYWNQPRKWAREAAEAGVRRRVFCASLSDVFEDRPDLVAPRARLLKLISELPELDWLLLTKRPENMLRLAEPIWGDKNWPAHVWAGTTVENEENADRIHHLANVPARIRFLSCEPLLGPVDLRLALSCCVVHWVIVGGESGRGARTYDLAWARDIITQCRRAEVPVFHKQLGERPFDSDATIGDQPVTTGKGGDPNEWPEELRVRQFPGGYES